MLKSISKGQKLKIKYITKNDCDDVNFSKYDIVFIPEKYKTG